MRKATGFAALSIAILFGTGSPASAWTPPIGIPDPGFGITDTAGATTYYVNNAVACNDANNAGHGSSGSPRCTIPTTITADDVVEVHGGPYIYNTAGPYAFIASGTAGHMAFVRGIDDGAGAPWIVGPALQSTGIDGRTFRMYGSYYIIEGFRFGNGTTLAPMIGGDHGVFRNNEIVNFQPPYLNPPTDLRQTSAAMQLDILPDSAHGSDHMLIYNNHIHHNGNYLATVDSKVHGIKFSVYDANAADQPFGGGSYIWILNNEIDHNGGGALQFGDDSVLAPTTQWTRFIYVGFNHMHHDREGGGGSKAAHDIIFSQNDIGPYLPLPVGSFQPATSTNLIVGKNGAHNNWALFNTIHDGIIGLRTNNNVPDRPHDVTLANIYMIGNLVTGMHSANYNATQTAGEGACVEGFGSTVKTYVVDNTMINCDMGVNFDSVGYFEVTGNLLKGVGDPMAYVPTAWGTNKYDYNFYDATARLAYSSMTPIISLATMQGHGQETHSRQGSALLDSKYKPGSGSPVVDVSVRSAVYDTFFSLYGINIAKDIQGATRPQGLAWDIGAYELGSQTGSPPPPPSGLVVR